MGSDRVKVEGQKSSSLIPRSKPKEKFSFLQPLYQDRVETDSVQENKQPNNPTPALGHSFGQMSVRPIQAKLTIGEPNDKYEQEADRVASQVVQQINTPSSAQLTQGQSVQRMEEEPDEEEIQPKRSIAAIQRRLISPVVQQMGEPDEEELQAKLIHQRITATEGGQLSSDVQRPNKTGLPDRIKIGIENLSGYSMEDVKVHYNSEKPAQLQALAYTQGTDIHVAPGQEKHLPHEAWHVVQQKQGRVKPTMQTKGMQINDDRGLEREADVMGKKVLQRQPIVPKEYDSPRRMTMNSKKLIQPDSPRNLLFGTQTPVQMINVGWVPSNPGNWRNVTNLAGNNAATKGGGAMNRNAVQTNNIAQAGTGAVLINLPANHMLSDCSNVDMPTYTQARDLAPECDHIVEVQEGGANDYENARMITKAENNASATPRPDTPAYGGNIADVNLRIYTPVTIHKTKAVPGGPYNLATGNDLTLNQTKALVRYSWLNGIGFQKDIGGWNEVDNKVVDEIWDTDEGYTLNGVKIT